MVNGARKTELIRRHCEPTTAYQKAIGINPPPLGYVYTFEKAQSCLSLFLNLDLHDWEQIQSFRKILDLKAELFGLLRIGGKRRYHEEQEKLRTLYTKPAVAFSDEDWAWINVYTQQVSPSFHYGRPILFVPSFVHLVYFQLGMEKSAGQSVEYKRPQRRLPESCDSCRIANCPSYRSSDLYAGVPDDCPLLNDSMIGIRQNLIEDVNLSIALQHRKAGLTRLEAQVSTLRAQGKMPTEIADILKKDRAQVTRLVQSSERKLTATHRDL